MKKILTKIGLVLISVVIGLSPLFVAIPISAATLYEYDTYQDSNGLYNGAYNFWAQTFTPNSDHTISQVYLLVMAGADPTGTTTTVRITNTTEDLPSTTIYGNATFSNNGIGTSYPADFTWKVATFSSPVSITNGTKYAIVVSTDLEAGMYWGKDTGNHLLYGNAAYSVDGGSTWNTDTGNDMTFQIYGDPSPTITPTPSPTGTPPTVTTGMAYRESATSVSLYGSLDSLGTASTATVGFNVGTGIPAEWYFDSYASPMNAVGGFYLTLTGLTENATYWYQACATGNGTGSGIYKTFSTGLPQVTTNEVDYAASDSAFLGGTLISLSGYPSVDVNFGWGTDSNCTNILQGYTAYSDGIWENAFGSIHVMNTTGYFNAFLPNLTPSTTYYCRAILNYDIGAPIYGDVVQFETAGTNIADDPQVVTLNPLGITGTDWQLNGNLTQLGNFTPVNAYFQYSLLSPLSWTSTTGQSVDATGTYNETIHNLQPYTFYSYRAIASNGHRLSTGSTEAIAPNAIIFFTGAQGATPDATPISLTVTDYEVAIRTKNSATLTAYVSGLTANDTVNMFFQWGLASLPTGTYTGTETTSRTNSGTVSVNVTGLTPATTYKFRAYGLANNYAGAYGADVTFTTLNADGSTPTPTGTPGPTPTPTPTSTSTPPIIPIPEFPELNSYVLLLILLVAGPLVLVLIMHTMPKLGVICGGIFDIGVFAYWVSQGWINPILLILLILFTGLLIWAVAFRR